MASASIKTEPSPRLPLAPLGLPLALLIAATLLIRAFDLDRAVARHFYADSNWTWRNATLLKFLYRFGAWPALVVTILGAAAWLLSWRHSRWAPYRRVGGFVAVLCLLGNGLVVNLAFKDHFGRPRPSQVTEFNGKMTFLPIGRWAPGQDAHSFPSGHASMGFFWLGLFVYYWRIRRRLALWFLAAGLLHGAVMGLTRIIQGDHWLSDVLWAGGMVYFVAWALCWGLRFLEDRKTGRVRRAVGFRI